MVRRKINDLFWSAERILSEPADVEAEYMFRRMDRRARALLSKSIISFGSFLEAMEHTILHFVKVYNHCLVLKKSQIVWDCSGEKLLLTSSLCQHCVKCWYLHSKSPKVHSAWDLYVSHFQTLLSIVSWCTLFVSFMDSNQRVGLRWMLASNEAKLSQYSWAKSREKLQDNRRLATTDWKDGETQLYRHIIMSLFARDSRPPSRE